MRIRSCVILCILVIITISVAVLLQANSVSYEGTFKLSEYLLTEDEVLSDVRVLEITKAGTTSATYVATDLIKHKVVPLGFNTFLHSAGGKVLPYGFAAYAWGHTAYSIFCTDPIARANQRGYGLR